MVWARAGVRTLECPKSYITGESVGWLDAYVAWKKLGRPDLPELGAREAEAMLLLDHEMSEEVKRGQQ